MKSTLRFASWFAAIVAAMATAGCATSQDAAHGKHQAGRSSAPPAGMMSPGASGEQATMMGMKDMKAMCDMHKKMMSAKTPEEHQAMMDEHSKTMSPEMMKQHMAMMENCK